MYGIEGLLAGRTLVERYRVDSVVGRGGMGAVYRAHDLRLGREVAVKVITVAAADADAHRRLRARFLREARAAAALHHQNVVQVFDYGTDPTLQLDFLVMELLRGEDLATRLGRKGPPAIGTALNILWQAARGLAVGHRAGMIHRDVKPGNLFLELGDRIGEVHVKVLDFGIADIGGGDDEQTVTHLTVIGRSPFSPAYASPEQLRGEAALSPATDVFSLGAVGFHLFTGARAFATTDPREMVVELSGAASTHLGRVRGLHPEARGVVQRALSPDPRDRYPHAGAFAAALEPFVDHRGTTDEPETRAIVEAEAPRPSRPEGTMFLPEPAPPVPRRWEEPREISRGGADLEELRRRAPAPSPSPAPQRVPAGGGFRRTARAAWELCLTAVAAVLFAGSWFTATVGIQDGDRQRALLGAAAAVFTTPWAIHRVLRRPGSYRFALFASITGSAGVAVLLREENLASILGAVFIAQVSLCLAAERLTRRRADEIFPD